MSKPKKASKKTVKKKETWQQRLARHNREKVAPGEEFERKVRELRAEFWPSGSGTLDPETYARWMGRQLALEKAWSDICRDIHYDHNVPESAR